MTRGIINLLPDLTLVSSCFIAFILNKELPIHRFENSITTILGLLVMFFGVISGVLILSSLRNKHTSTNAADTPSILIKEGVFSISRNPYYLASLISTAGFALILGSIVSFISPAIYFFVMNLIVIPQEESNLLNKFGQQYISYKSSTRRWF